MIIIEQRLTKEVRRERQTGQAGQLDMQSRLDIDRCARPTALDVRNRGKANARRYERTGQSSERDERDFELDLTQYSLTCRVGHVTKRGDGLANGYLPPSIEEMRTDSVDRTGQTEDYYAACSGLSAICIMFLDRTLINVNHDLGYVTDLTLDSGLSDRK